MGDYFVHSSSCIDDDVIIGEGTKIWNFSHIQSGAKIGRNCTLGQNVNVSNNVEIGDGCKIQNNVSIYEGVKIGNHVFCGPSCVFTNDLFPRCEYPKGRENYEKTIIEDGASIGANATIVCGNRIGAYSMIAAGAVITKNVKKYALMVGVPGNQVGWVCKCGNTMDENYRCIKCGKEYRLDNVSGELAELGD